MQNSKPVSTPLTSHFCLYAKLSLEADEEKEHVTCVPYASAVSLLMYSMVCIHLDISHAIGVSRYMENSGKEHWHIVKWILCYLKGCSYVGLVYERSSDTHRKCR